MAKVMSDSELTRRLEIAEQQSPGGESYLTQLFDAHGVAGAERVNYPEALRWMAQSLQSAQTFART